jgi:superfamily II DNA/RNA helicase
MLRRLKQEIETQLPDRTIKNYLVVMEPEQKIRYEEYEKRVSRLLAQAKSCNLRKEEHEQLQRYLACMRMICDTPYILDPACKISPKLQELDNILEDLLIDPHAKIIIFSEWARMLELVRELAIVKKIEFAWHTGSIHPAQRQQEINKFKTLSNCRLFLSTDAGSVGLNLQVAHIVINLDLPWNPAKLEQRIARAWRKNQTRMVRVINFVCENSIEERMLSLLSQKQNLYRSALDGDPELKTMRLPSGSKALVERLANLMGSQVKELNSTELLVQEVLQIAKITNKQVMAVFNHNLNQVNELSQQEMTKKPTNNVVEIIDKSTFKLLKHLEQQRILRLNTNVQLLVNSTDLTFTKQQCNSVESI